jgi:hypothetical protein
MVMEAVRILEAVSHNLPVFTALAHWEMVEAFPNSGELDGEW